MKSLIVFVLVFASSNIYAAAEVTKKQLCRSDILHIGLVYRSLGEIAGEISLRQALIKQAKNQETKDIHQRLLIELDMQFNEVLAQGEAAFEASEKNCVDQIPD